MGLRSRWDFEVDAGVDLPIVFHYDPLLPPRQRFTAGQYAARAAWSMLDVDMSLGYVYLYDRMPIVNVNVRPSSVPSPTQIDVDLEFRFQRVHMVAASFERALGKLRLAGEALGVLTEDWETEDAAVPDPYVTVVMGGDYRTAQFLFDHTIHFFLEAAITQSVKGEITDEGFDAFRFPLQRALLARVAYEMGEDATFQLNIAQALDGKDTMVNPEIEISLGSQTKFEIGGLWLRGDAGSLFETYADNSRVTLSIKAEF
jgi:hypothetical protein